MNSEAHAKDTLNLENPIVKDYRGFLQFKDSRGFSQFLQDLQCFLGVLSILQGLCKDFSRRFP